MRGKLTLLAGVCAGAIAIPAYAQTAPADTTAVDSTEIVVTAQRTSEKLQNVPIAVSAFNTEALERQQIKNTSDLQLSLPNVTFTKTNFTSSSFTIRGIGDLCVGTTCDSATAIHYNDAPLFGTRLFEGEFYDLAQIEVLRGPQGTLYGRNATSGVVNFRTAKPKLGQLEASVEAEYGNYNGVKTKGMLNVPIGDIAAVRIAGFYLNRDGYTTNTFNNTKIDDRDMYGVRGSVRIQPSSGTTIDFMGQYFREKDSRMRIQKQLCQRDPTGVLGCLNGTRGFETTNANTSFVGVLTSKEFLATAGIPGGFALGSLYGVGSTPAAPIPGVDPYSGVVNPADYRTVATDTQPSYYTRETILQASIEQEMGGGLDLKVSGNFQNVAIDSSQDYNNSVQNRAGFAGGLNTLNFFAAGGAGPFFASYFAPIAAALIPGGPTGVLCTSLAEETGTGAFGGHKVCSATPQDFDRSNSYNTSWSAEAILASKWDGPFNFLLGGIYSKLNLTESSYYVDSFGIDYLTGVLGSFTSLGNKDAATGNPSPLPPSYLGTPTYRNNTDSLRIKSYGLFGEAYFKFNDAVKLTVGLRYNHDQKSVSARTTLASFLVPYGSTNAYSSPFIGAYDADPSIAGNQLFANANVTFGKFTGRAVLDWQITRNNLLYISYSRGYKSGGINPPLSPVAAVPTTFAPEFVNAYEIGSKNTFAGGKMTLNLTAFMYDYKGLQLSRIVSRTSVNDNVNAKIYGLEAEMVLRPIPEFTINMNASYLHSKVTSTTNPLANPRDFGGGRADAVIIKDITNGANCAVASTSGSVAGVNAFVGAINGAINAGIPDPLYTGATLGAGGTVGHFKPLLINPGANLQTTTYNFGANSGIASTGAFGICAVLGAQASAIGGAFGGIQYFSAGIPSNVVGNKLPGAPDYKFSAGMQYAAPIGDLTLTPRVDYIYTGKSQGSVFNSAVNQVPAFSQINAQIQLDGADKKWFVRGWIQNLSNNTAITGLYVTDQSSGLYSNVFTLEPRRYGVTAGLKF